MLERQRHTLGSRRSHIPLAIFRAWNTSEHWQNYMYIFRAETFGALRLDGRHLHLTLQGINYPTSCSFYYDSRLLDPLLDLHLSSMEDKVAVNF